MKKLNKTTRGDHRRTVACCTGKDEMNLLEHSFSSASTRVCKSVEELVFERIKRDPTADAPVIQRLSISFSSKFGRPSVEDDEVYVGLQAITHQQLQQGHTSPRIEFTRYELVNTLGWSDCGASYDKIDRAINRLGGVWILSDNAFYDREAASWVDTKFHIVDESHLFTRERYDLARERTRERPMSWIRWGEPFFRSIANGNLSTFDLGVYRAITGGVAKKLYRYSTKRLYQRRQYAIDLRELAEDKLGFKRRQAISELTRMLERSFDELLQFGFKIKLEPEGKSTLAIISKSRSTSDKPAVVERLPTGLEKELIKRGVDRSGKNSASKLVARHSESHIQEQMENFDDRLAHGEHLSPGWLVAAIESEQGYSFRKGFKSSTQKKAEAEKRRQLQAAKAATQERERQELAERQRQAQDAHAEFEELRNSFSEHEQITLEDEALKRCDKFMRDLVLKARRRGEVSLYHQMLWERYIFPTVDDSRRELEKCRFES